MIQQQSYLTVADNTGVKKLMCIRVLGNNRNSGSVGDIIIGVVKDVLPNMLIKRSKVVRAVIVRTKSFINRKDGTRLRFYDNAAIIINEDRNPCGTRVFGPIAREIRERKFSKIISLSTEVI